MDQGDSAAMEANLQGLNQYLNVQKDQTVPPNVHLVKPRHEVQGQSRFKDGYRDKPSLLLANRHTQDYLKEEREDGYREKDQELSFRPYGDTMRTTFTSQTDRNSPARTSLPQKGTRLLNADADQDHPNRKEEIGTEITDVFKHYDTLSHELSTLYSEKLRAARDEVRRETEKASLAESKREEAESRGRQIDEENSYLRGELDIERKKLREKESELRKLRREKIAWLRNEGQAKTSQTSREIQDQLDMEASRRSHLEKDLESLQSTLTQTIKERDLLRDEVQQLQKTTNQAQMEMSSSAAVREELEFVLRQIQQDRSDMSSLLQSLAKNKETIESLGQKNERLEIKYREARDENDKLAEALNELSQEASKVPALEGQLEDLKRELKSQAEELKRFSSTNLDQEKNLKVYKDKVDTLMGLNDYMEKSLRDAEERGKKVFHDKHDEVGNLKDRVQQTVSDNIRLKKRVSELEGAIEIAEIEAEQMRKKEENMADQVAMLHEDLMAVSAQLTSQETGQQQAKRESQNQRKLIDQLESELDFARGMEENSGRVIKAYEILLGDIAAKVTEANGPKVPVPTVNIEKFSETGERDRFMSRLCAFEDGVKLALEAQRNSRPQSVKESKKDRSPQSRGADPGVYPELLEKLKTSVIESLSLVEDLLPAPESLHELSEIILEYCDARLNLKKQEDRLLEKELLMNHSTDKIEIAKRSKEINLMKISLQSIEDRVNFLEDRQKELFDDLRQQLGEQKDSASINSVGKDSLQMNEAEDVPKLTKPKTTLSYTPTRFNQNLGKTSKGRQSFFQVSEVDDVISNLIDNKGY